MQRVEHEDHEERALLTDALEVHFIEFPKFERVEKDTSIALHRWLMFMDEKLPEDQLKELMDMDPIIAKTEEKLEELSLEERFKDFLDDKERYLRDWVYSVDVTAKKAAEEARKKALLDSRTEMAQKMLAKGMDLKTIAEVSGMSEEQIRQLQDE